MAPSALGGEHVLTIPICVQQVGIATVVVIVILAQELFNQVECFFVSVHSLYSTGLLLIGRLLRRNRSKEGRDLGKFWV